MTEVRGTAEMVRQAEKGLALFAEEEEWKLDTAAAQAFKAGVDAQIAALNEEINALAGKENKKARTEKSKEAAALSKTDEYIDAVRVLKGNPPAHGHFATGGGKKEVPTQVQEEEQTQQESLTDNKKGKKEKMRKEDSAGISKAERDELEKLKKDIVSLKTELKEQGMTGGQINKDERVVKMVTRMNELKEKESPGSAMKDKKSTGSEKKKKMLSSELSANAQKLQEDIDAYRNKLQHECGYTKKEINNDPDLKDMIAELSAITGRAK